MSSPPGAAPDEPAHYLRAVGAGRGQLILDQRPSDGGKGEQLGRGEAWQRQQSRMVTIPGSLSPEIFACRATPFRVAECRGGPPGTMTPQRFPTYVGTYPPYPYILPGLAMRLGSDPLSALRWGRAAAGLMSALLIAAAILAFWEPSKPRSSIVGIVVAVTPMTIFASSTLSASGPEIASAACFYACVLRVARTDPAPKWVWILLATSAALLATGRDLGLLWVGIGVALLISTAGLKGTVVRLREGGRTALVALGVTALASAAALLWQLAIQVHPNPTLDALLASARPSIAMFTAIFYQTVGVFGVLDTLLPLMAYTVWALMLLVLFGTAMWAGTARRRIVLGSLAMGLAFLTVILDATQAPLGFGLQGRHILPLAILLPLAAGEMLISSTRDVEGLPFLNLSVVLTLAAAVHLVAWHTIGRRYSVGLEGPQLFLADPRWSPPLGWVLWGTVALAGALLLSVTGFRQEWASKSGSLHRRRRPIEQWLSSAFLKGS